MTSVSSARSSNSKTSFSRSLISSKERVETTWSNWACPNSKEVFSLTLVRRRDDKRATIEVAWHRQTIFLMRTSRTVAESQSTPQACLGSLWSPPACQSRNIVLCSGRGTTLTMRTTVQKTVRVLMYSPQKLSQTPASISVNDRVAIVSDLRVPSVRGDKAASSALPPPWVPQRA